MNKRSDCIQGLGEVCLHVKDLDAMHRFYEDVMGLDVLRRDESYVFFKVAEGYDTLTQKLALFETDDRFFLETKFTESGTEKTTLHHIAFNVSLADFGSEKKRLEGLGLAVRETVHEWLHIRSLYFSDPEENLLEFVAYDATV